MSLSKSNKWIPAVYIGLALWAAAAILAAVLLAFTPVAHVAHTADLGPQGVPALLAKTEKLVSQQAAANGFTLLSQSLYSTSRPNPDTIILVLRVKTKELGVQFWHVTYTRGVWTATGGSITR